MSVMPEAAHAPFERHDAYGKMGMGRQSAWIRLKTCLAAVTILPVKAVGTLSCVLGFFCICKAMQVLPRRHRSAAVAATGKAFCRACLLCVGFTRVTWVQSVRLTDDRTGPQPHAAGIVSNHCSWADILVHMAHSFPSFVARSGTDSLPFIGFIRWAAHNERLCVFRRLLCLPQNVRCLAASRWSASMWSGRARQQLLGCGGHGELCMSGRHVLLIRCYRVNSWLQGVASLVKERMLAAGDGAAHLARPMLLFPEVCGCYYSPYTLSSLHDVTSIQQHSNK